MRSAGVLLPITALPSPYGVGTLGQAARDFVAFLAAAKQTYWQILPLTTTSYGDSPYQSFSSFAGNPYLIDFADLQAWNLLAAEDYQNINWGSDPTRVDYALLYQERYKVLAKAVSRMYEQMAEEFALFAQENAFWLADYALFMAIKGHFANESWFNWPAELRLRQETAIADIRAELAPELAFWQGVQFLFFKQWQSLKTYANEHGIKIIGDLPIYVAADSADMWRHPEQFQLDADLRPLEVAGCPPDGFSDSGQLWGNPLFNWEYMAQENYQWWMTRLQFQFKLYDVLRIDHFRAFDSYYAIPATAVDARNGSWKAGPGIKFFQTLEATLGKREIIAEDLGFLTESVHRLLKDTGYPGMRVLEFAFDSRDGSGSLYLPHNFVPNCIAYVGTHDNETALGWLATAPAEDVALAREYLHLSAEEGENWGMMRALWSSVADCVIVQMQDLLGIGVEGRINTPATLNNNNWSWRMAEHYADEALSKRLARNMELYGRQHN